MSLLPEHSFLITFVIITHNSLDCQTQLNMADRSDYPLTHSPPDNTELALLNAYIDQRAPGPKLRHKNRMFTLLQANGMISRSIVEQRFLSRVLSIYAEEKANRGEFGADHQIDTASLDIRCGHVDDKPYYAIATVPANALILRGATRNTKAQAMECFIDTVLLLSASAKKDFEALRDAENARNANNAERSIH
ncbi:hypothetical protein HBI25_125170 [Parastagonospora nodorum]|nr:hypothetical protein HBH51_093200 [Parastagonospora nodorum]KAH4048936.1 hypothetical protein HBH49_153210 [Parastagonospora nodorum]KAH4103781.1 hypothetical protein HBH46_106760 [Parastagonospora nodorum]KAH4187468.1 hypothetical protein HBH42_158180 [Parastagonospora nodorum]KAH4222541.1 hypothetical protein HBI06_147680 [Parastagonospora nodorum]